MGDLARRVHAASLAEWGEHRATVLVGRHPSLAEALERCARFAEADSPVLLTGETGTGKELFARALFLCSSHHRRAYLSVNCAQYGTGDLIASELFGHRKGSFTGAVADRKGIFEEANGGVVFLDEVGELPPTAQAMLLRTLSEGEVLPVGSSQPRRVDVRVVAATSRELEPLVEAGRFRADLYYRLRYLHVHVPALRERGDDWELIARHYLDGLSARRGTPRHLSQQSMCVLRTHLWPGNVREVKSVVETGYHMATGTHVEPADFGSALTPPCGAGHAPARAGGTVHDHVARMAAGDETFWEAIYHPFLNRDLNRAEVRAVIAAGLDAAHGSYKHLLTLFGIAPEDYLKFMDFLRHQRLKPER